MANQSSISTSDETDNEQSGATRADESEYDLPIELYAGTVILIIGVLVAITPFTAEMPTDWVWDPVMMNTISGAIYITAGVFLLHRHSF